MALVGIDGERKSGIDVRAEHVTARCGADSQANLHDF